MLLARPLFTGKNEFEILTKINDADLGALDKYGKDLHPDLLWLVRTALSRQRSQRFQTAGAFAVAVRGVALRMGLQFDPGELTAFMGRAGLLASSSGTHEITRAERFAKPVRSAMATKLDTVQVHESLNDLIPIFDRDRVAIVMDGDHFVGLITRVDLINHLRLNQ